MIGWTWFAAGLSDNAKSGILGAGAGAVVVALGKVWEKWLGRKREGAEADGLVVSASHQLIEDYRDQVAELKGEMAAVKVTARELAERVTRAEADAAAARASEHACLTRVAQLESSVAELVAQVTAAQANTTTIETKITKKGELT